MALSRCSESISLKHERVSGGGGRRAPCGLLHHRHSDSRSNAFPYKEKSASGSVRQEEAVRATMLPTGLAGPSRLGALSQLRSVSVLLSSASPPSPFFHHRFFSVSRPAPPPLLSQKVSRLSAVQLVPFPEFRCSINVQISRGINKEPKMISIGVFP